MPRRYNKMPALTQAMEAALRQLICEWETVVQGAPYKFHRRACLICKATPGDSCNQCVIFQRLGTYCITKTGAYARYLRALTRHPTQYGNPEVVKEARSVLRFLRDTLRLGLKARERKG